MFDEGCARCGKLEIAGGDLCAVCDEERWAGVDEEGADVFARLLATTPAVTAAEWDEIVAEAELARAIADALEAASAALGALPAVAFGEKAA